MAVIIEGVCNNLTFDLFDHLGAGLVLNTPWSELFPFLFFMDNHHRSAVSTYQHDNEPFSCRRRECACVGLSSQLPNTNSLRWKEENDPSDLGALTKEAIWHGPPGPDRCCVWLRRVWSCRAAEATCGCYARAVWMAGRHGHPRTKAHTAEQRKV